MITIKVKYRSTSEDRELIRQYVSQFNNAYRVCFNRMNSEVKVSEKDLTS